MYIDLPPWILIALILVGAWVVLAALDKRGVLSKHNLEVSGPLLLWRTNYGKGTIRFIAHRFRPFWKKAGVLCIIISTVTMIFTAVLMIAQAILIIRTPEVIPPDIEIGEMILLPGLALPLTYGLVALIIAIIIHEFSHGLLSEAEGMNIKSLGLGVLVAIPLAFVEPDEEDIKNASSRSKMKMFAAGPAANIAAFAISFLIFTQLLLPMFAPIAEGVGISETIEGFPAVDAGMTGGEIITHVGGIRVKNIDDFQGKMTELSPGDIVEIGTNKDVYTIELGAHPDEPGRAFLGVNLFPVTEVYAGLMHPVGFVMPWVGATLPLLSPDFFGADLVHRDAVLTVLQLVFWVGLLNFWLGAINLLPAKPFDGGRLMEEYIKMLIWRLGNRDEKVANNISNWISVLFILAYIGPILLIVMT